MQREGIGRISSEALARSLGLSASQIRQDLNCFGGFGQQGYGYNVEYLLDELAVILNLCRNNKAIVVGAGNLGHALLNNFNFRKAGFEVIAAFDKSPMLIGSVIGGVSVLAADTLADFVRLRRPDIAVLTLPKSESIATARLLADAGIRGLWNFTSADLSSVNLPIPVENVHFSESLMTLSYRLG